MADESILKTDLGIVVDEKGVADIGWPEGGDIGTVVGTANLRQALTLRILVGRGELGDVGHGRYGSYVSDLIGEPLDRTNLELLRRYVRQALRSEPRVKDVTQVVVRVRPTEPGIVDIDAKVTAINDAEIEVRLALRDLGEAS